MQIFLKINLLTLDPKYIIKLDQIVVMCDSM